MTERERLMNLIIQAVLPLVGEPIQGLKQLEMIASFLLENGVILPPCKIGDTVYHTDFGGIHEAVVENVIYDTSRVAFDETAIGYSAFLTREEAEAEIERRQKRA